MLRLGRHRPPPSVGRGGAHRAPSDESIVRHTHPIVGISGGRYLLWVLTQQVVQIEAPCYVQIERTCHAEVVSLTVEVEVGLVFCFIWPLKLMLNLLSKVTLHLTVDVQVEVGLKLNQSPSSSPLPPPRRYLDMTCSDRLRRTPPLCHRRGVLRLYMGVRGQFDALVATFTAEHPLRCLLSATKRKDCIILHGLVYYSLASVQFSTAMETDNASRRLVGRLPRDDSSTEVVSGTF